MKTYVVISGALFGLIALLHAVRLVLHWPAQVGSWDVPFWVSWLGILLPGGLCIWAFLLARVSRPVS